MRSATSVLFPPSAQAKTIRQRSASAWALLGRRAQRSSVCALVVAEHHWFEHGPPHLLPPIVADDGSNATGRTKIPPSRTISDSGH